jgi:hypothetical protein|tara:strand:+ start:143 stop:490 length:348 start_codon:yes stop_codon:yes gene_type:complete
MFSIQKRTLLFLLACIPARIILALLPLYIESSYLPYYGLLLLIPTLGFLYLYFNNLRLNAVEAGGHTWWADYRLIHGLLYLCASIYALQEKILAWIPLTIDVVLGLVLFIIRYLS